MRRQDIINNLKNGLKTLSVDNGGFVKNFYEWIINPQEIAAYPLIVIRDTEDNVDSETFDDLIIFGSLIVLIIVASKDKKLDIFLIYRVIIGLLQNPMIVSIVCGLLWSASGWSLPEPVNDFVVMLGSAATPGALFAIGASLAQKSAERFEIAAWLSFCKLVLHPLAICIAVFFVFDVDLYAATVMIAAASLPVAGNIFMVAHHYNVAPKRASTAIFLSTVLSIFTVSFTIAWVSTLN
jgi:malonate transporter